jgi:hypothetical protein
MDPVFKICTSNINLDKHNLGSSSGAMVQVDIISVQCTVHVTGLDIVEPSPLQVHKQMHTCPEHFLGLVQ